MKNSLIIILSLILSGWQYSSQNQLVATDKTGFETVFFSKKSIDSLPPIHYLQQISTIFSSPAPIPPDQLTKMEIELLQEGDLLLRKGYGWISDRIADFLDEEIRITHCGLILREGYSAPHILHSLSNEKVNGIFIEPLSEYLLESQKGTLIGVRLKGSVANRISVIKEAKRLHKKVVPFDMAFNDADTSAFYCAELMGYIFRQVYHKDLLPEKTNTLGIRAIRMRNFLNSTNFEILFNHFTTEK